MFCILPFEKEFYKKFDFEVDYVGNPSLDEIREFVPTTDFRELTEGQMKGLLKLPFKVVDHIAAVRPAAVERRPFVGWHPVYTNAGILNGMGTKGCSLAPWFAKQLVENITGNKPVDSLADVGRFKRMLSN